METPPMHFSADQAVTHVNKLQSLASSLGVSIWTILQIVLQYGPKIVPILTDVMEAFKGGFTWDKVATILKSDGPEVYALALAIAAALGVKLPPLPA